jgi:predicted AAA+ superfamily ATPase
MAQYKKRIADEILSRKLQGIGAVLIVGPKWCGKTTTAEQQAKSKIYMDDIDEGATLRDLATISPRGILKGDTPRLIDEWQLAPKIWDAVRFEVDHRGEEGQFILTGSAVPASMEQINHTGTGRFSWLTMRTMSLWESGNSTG